MDDKIREFEENFSVLDRYGEDVTKQEFITNPAIGRDQQLKELILILLTPEKSAILIGKPGIGKTAIVEGLAWMLQKGDVPDALKGYTIINIKTASLLGTMPSGESKVQKMIDELKTKEKVILFVDEVHMLIGATDSSSLDFANIFKEGLGRGSIKVIGATTTEEYERYILRDKAFTRRFQKVEVPEPTTEETIKIMMGTLPKFEKQTGKKMKYTSFIQERIMTFLVDITSEYKRVYALGSRYPDVCLTLLKQAFSYTVYDNRDYMDIFDVRKAIENSKNIYPDVIKKNLPIFDKTFNDIILEEKGEKPIEEWRKESGPTRFEQEQMKNNEQNSSSISYGDISSNIIKSLTGNKEEDTVGDDMDNGTQMDNQNTMVQQIDEMQNMNQGMYQNMNQMNPMINQQMMNQQMINQGMYQQDMNQMMNQQMMNQQMMNQGMYQNMNQNQQMMPQMMNQGMYQNMNQMNPMGMQMMPQMMNQQIQNMNPMMNQMQNGNNDSQQDESTDVFDDVGENTATHILTDFSAPRNRDNRKKREPRRRNNDIDNLSYVPNMVDKKQLKNMEPVKGIMGSKALRGINESFDTFGSQSTVSSSSDLDDLLLGGGIKTLENHKESELDFAKRVTKSNDLEMSKSSVLLGDSIASTLDVEDINTEPVARYKSGNFTGRTSGTDNSAFMYDDDRKNNRRNDNRNKGQLNGRFLSDDDGNNRIQATLDRINPPRNDNNDYYNDGRDFMDAMSDVHIQNGRISEGKKRRPRDEEYYDEDDDDGDYYEDSRYGSKRRENNSSYINFSNINELASEESRKEKRYFVPESEKIMNSLNNNNQNDDNDDNNNGRNNVNQNNNFDLNNNGIDDRQELAMLQNMYQQAMMNQQMMNQPMMNQMNPMMMPQQQMNQQMNQQMMGQNQMMNQPMMGQNPMMNQPMMNQMNPMMMPQQQMNNQQMNQPMDQQINQSMMGQNLMMNQQVMNKPPVDLTLNENEIDDFFDE